MRGRAAAPPNTLQRVTSEPDLPPSARRVQDTLAEAGSRARVRILADSARTAADAADALDVPVGAIVKSLVFVADGHPVLVLASGDHQVDTHEVGRALDAHHVGRADAEMVRDATGFAIGGVAPVAHPHPLRTVVDSALGRFEVVWAAAGTPHAVFPTSYDELVRLTDGIPAAVGAG